MMPGRLIALSILCLALARTAAPAECMNKFLNRSEGTRQIVTMLTGKLTYQEAYSLAKAIKEGQAPPVEWVAESGRSIARQYGDLKVVRPMPVGCDGKKSGVIMVATFVSVQKPAGKINVKLDEKTTVALKEQGQ
jgi:hypothetical protein